MPDGLRQRLHDDVGDVDDIVDENREPEGSRGYLDRDRLGGTFGFPDALETQHIPEGRAWTRPQKRRPPRVRQDGAGLRPQDFLDLAAGQGEALVGDAQNEGRRDGQDRRNPQF